jgi:hypothetical protein
MRRIAVVSNYSELIACLRQRAEALNISNEVIDEVSGLQDGYTGKVLGLHPSRNLGKLSLPLLLNTLGLKLAVLEDRQQLARLRPRLQPRKKNGPGRHIEPAGGQ